MAGIGSTVSVIAGSESDWEYRSQLINLLQNTLGIDLDSRTLSAHRQPKALRDYVVGADRRGCKMFICMAGMSAALPGAVAAITDKPVIGVPLQGKMNGMDALLSVAQMPSGVPVACMAVDGVTNAALLAARILALTDSQVKKKLLEYKKTKGIELSDA